jgi:hypothetical protein
MKLLEQYGRFKVIEQWHIAPCRKTGLKAEWHEYQVREGRRVLSRHGVLINAMRDAEARNNALWNEIERQLGA